MLASRSPANDPKAPAKARFRSLAKGRRDDKFKELGELSLADGGWIDCAADPRAPFLPAFTGGWADFVALDAVIDDSGSGIMPGRTWVIAPDKATLEKRWKDLIAEPNHDRKELLFHPQLREGVLASRHVRKMVEQGLGSKPPSLVTISKKDGQIASLTQYGFRTFDRQWIPADARLLNDPRPTLWNGSGGSQVFLTAPMDLTPSSGPALSATATMPDLHHYAGRGGRVFALWKDAAASQTNVSDAAIAALTRAYGSAPDPVDIFAYVAALLANPAYTARFQPDLIRPGLRVPLTADAKLFAKAAKLGREIIWLHSFGERMAEGRPAGPPRLPKDRAPTIPAGGAIPSAPEDFPDTIEHDASLNRLIVGKGHIDNVPSAVWKYEVSGKQVLRQWFSYRKKNRERPQIGDKRPPSPLQAIQPDHWLSEYTSELLNVLNVLGLLVELEPKQAQLLEEICDGPLIPASKVVPGSSPG